MFIRVSVFAVLEVLFENKIVLRRQICKTKRCAREKERECVFVVIDTGSLYMVPKYCDRNPFSASAYKDVIIV